MPAICDITVPNNGDLLELIQNEAEVLKNGLLAANSKLDYQFLTVSVKRLVLVRPSGLRELAMASRVLGRTGEPINNFLIRLFLCSDGPVAKAHQHGWVFGVNQMRAACDTSPPSNRVNMLLLLGGYGVLKRQMRVSGTPPPLIKQVAAFFPTSERLFTFAATSGLKRDEQIYLERLATLLTPTTSRRGDRSLRSSPWLYAKEYQLKQRATFVGRRIVFRETGIDLVVRDSADRKIKVVCLGSRTAKFRIANARIEHNLTYLTGLEPALLSRILRLKPEDTFLDIGANIGIYTVLAAARGAKCIAVEPFLLNVEELKKNLEINDLGSSVIVLDCAVGARPRTVRLSYSRAIAGIGAQNLETSRRFDPRDRRPSMYVPVETIDDLLARRVFYPPSMVKIDVDGDEAGVFDGMITLLRDHPPKIVMIESLPGSPISLDIARNMKELGYFRSWGDDPKNMFFEKQ